MLTRVGMMLALGGAGLVAGRGLAVLLEGDVIGVLAPLTLGLLGALFGAAFAQKLQRH